MTKLALLTGSSRGLGQALAEQLRGSGWRVRGLARHAVHADDLAVDLTDPLAIEPAVAQAFQGIAPDTLTDLVVVHNAATVTPLGHTAGQPVQAVVDAVQLNFTAGILLMAAVMARCQTLPARKVLALVTSAAAERPHPGLSVYGATKAGLEQHLRVLACEQLGQPHPFIVVSLDPGALDTGMQATLRSADPAAGVQVQGFVQRQLDGSLADPRQVAAALAAQLEAADLVGGQRYRVRPIP